MNTEPMRLWFVDRSHWEIGEVAGFIIRASTAEQALAIANEQRENGWEDVSKISVRPCTYEGAEGVVATEVGTTPPCDE